MKTDVAIVGGGLVGLATALALAEGHGRKQVPAKRSEATKKL